MGDTWIPEGLMDMKPFFRNFFENTATVQVRMVLFHRLASMLKDCSEVYVGAVGTGCTCFINSDWVGLSPGLQLDHRILATSTLFSIVGMWAVTRKLPVDPRVRTLLNATFGMAALQVRHSPSYFSTALFEATNMYKSRAFSSSDIFLCELYPR